MPLTHIGRLHASRHCALPKIIEKNSSPFAGRFAEGFVGIRELVEQMFLGVYADGSTVVRTRHRAGSAIQNVQ